VYWRHRFAETCRLVDASLGLTCRATCARGIADEASQERGPPACSGLCDARACCCQSRFWNTSAYCQKPAHHLRDALNISVPVEVFCSCSLGAEGGGIGPLQYLFGIREQEANHVSETQPARHHELMNERHGRTTQERQVIMPHQLDVISESDTSGSDSDISAESSPLHLGKSAWVDIRSENLTLLQWTPGFASILRQPSPESSGFLKWLVEEQRQDFLAWVQAPAAERAENHRRVTLRLLRQGGDQGQGRSSKRHFTCTVFESVEELPETPNSSEVKVVRLDLLEPKKRRNNERSRAHSPEDILLWVEIPSMRV